MPVSQAKKDIQKKYLFLGLRIIGEFGATIAIPVVLFSLLGKRLDIRFDTTPWLYIAGFALAFVLSALRLWRRAKEIGKEYADIEKEK